jgi:Tfp pilus assembly protein PilF
MVKIIPDVRHYLLLSEIEYRNGNFNQSELLCRESLKLNIEFPEAYSGLAVISALKGNYTEGDDLIRKGNLIIYRNNAKKELFNKMRINEAAIALLKNEKERASVLLRNVLSVDNNNKGLQLYRRYFIKK